MLQCKDTSRLPPEPTLKASECLSQSQAAVLWEHQNGTPAHQFRQRVYISVWCTGHLLDVCHSHEKWRKQSVSQGLLHKEAWEEEFVFHCRQKLLMLFLSPSLGYKWDLERGTERARKKIKCCADLWSINLFLIRNYSSSRCTVYVLLQGTHPNSKKPNFNNICISMNVK